MEKQLLALLKTAQYAEVMRLIQENPTININYIDPTTKHTFLTAAVYTIRANKSTIALFINFLLQHPQFTQSMHFTINEECTAYNQALSSFGPDVIRIFMAHQPIEHSVFEVDRSLRYENMGKSIASTRNGLKESVSKGESTAIIQEKQERLARYEGIRPLLREITVRYATERNDVALLRQLETIDSVERACVSLAAISDGMKHTIFAMSNVRRLEQLHEEVSREHLQVKHKIYTDGLRKVEESIGKMMN